jgi:hypothetical protein
MSSSAVQSAISEESTTQEVTVECQAQLLAKIKHLEADNKRLLAESKIHQDAWTAEAEKYAALSAMADKEKHEHQVLQAKHGHVMKLIRTAESAYYEGCTTHNVFETNGCWQLYQKVVRAVQPVFVHRG